MRQPRSEAAALAKANFWLRIEHALLELAFAFRQLEDAFVEASLQKKGLLTAWKLWREMRREHHLSVRLLRLGWRLLPQDAAGIANAGQTWKSGELPGDLQAELLDRLTGFAPEHAWNPEKMRRVGSGCGLTPESLLQVLREKQTNAGRPPQA
jgi:hypothetical protein